MTAQGLAPFPSIPLELKAEILTHADTDTLAKACSVSLAFLQLAAPLLYRDITFVGPEGLEKFLTLRADVQVSELAPYLDLSLVRSVTYIDQHQRSFAPSFVAQSEFMLEQCQSIDRAKLFVPHRLLSPGAVGPTFSPLKIHSLSLIVSPTRSHTRLSEFFDPEVVRIEGWFAWDLGDQAIPLFKDPCGAPWTRLRTFICVDAIPDEPFFADPICWADLERVELEIVLTTMDCLALRNAVRSCGLPQGDGSFPGQVIFWVETEHLRGCLLEELVGSSLHARADVFVRTAPQTSAPVSAS